MAPKTLETLLAERRQVQDNLNQLSDMVVGLPSDTPHDFGPLIDKLSTERDELDSSIEALGISQFVAETEGRCRDGRCSRLLHIASIPAHFLLEMFHGIAELLLNRTVKLVVNKKVLVIFTGLLIATIGVIVAHNAPHEGPGKIAVDALGYGLHGFGFAPLVKVIAEFLSIEV